MATVQLGDIVFQEFATSGWVLTGLIDWVSTPSSKAESDSIPQGHGAFDGGRDWREAAIPSFKASYLGSSEADALEAVEALNALVTPDGDDVVVMSVTDALRTTSRDVSVRNVDVADQHGRSVIEVAVDCFAWDPFRYGPELVVETGLPMLSGGITFPITFPIDFGTSGDPGRLVLTNEGRQPSRPVFTASGGMAGGFSLACVETGQELRFEFPLAVSDSVTLDARSGQVWINDESNQMSGWLTKAEWFSVPPGGVRTVQFNAIGAVSGTPRLTGRVAPAWL